MDIAVKSWGFGNRKELLMASYVTKGILYKDCELQFILKGHNNSTCLTVVQRLNDIL